MAGTTFQMTATTCRAATMPKHKTAMVKVKPAERLGEEVRFFTPEADRKKQRSCQTVFQVKKS